MNLERNNISVLDTRMGRRALLRNAIVVGAGLAAVSAVGCSSEDPEIVGQNVTRSVDLKSMPLIPEQFASRGATKIINDEIFPRLGIPYFRQGRASEVWTSATLHTSAEVIFEDDRVRFRLDSDHKFGSSQQRIRVHWEDKTNGSRYEIGIKDSKGVVVVSGEKATEAEGQQIKNEFETNLIQIFNSQIKQGRTVQVSYTKDIVVAKTPTPKKQ